MTTGEKIFWGAFAAIVLAILAGALLWRAAHPVENRQTQIGALVASPEGLPGLKTDSGPWDANLPTLAARMDAIGFPKMSMEGAVMHIHQQLEIFIWGKPMVVPANIGINNFFSPIHTHDTSGIVHVEAPVVADFRLGQFFDVWGVRLTDTCIGGYCVDAQNKLRMFVNGVPYEGNPRELELAQHQQITIVYGADTDVPENIRSSYPFPAGY